MLVSPVCWRRGECIGRSRASSATRLIESGVRASSRGHDARSASRMASGQSVGGSSLTARRGLRVCSQSRSLSNLPLIQRASSTPTSTLAAARRAVRLGPRRYRRAQGMATRPVAVSWRELNETPEKLGDELHAAFGPDALGLLIVSGLPAEYAALRDRASHDLLAHTLTSAGAREDLRVCVAAGGHSRALRRCRFSLPARMVRPPCAILLSAQVARQGGHGLWTAGRQQGLLLRDARRRGGDLPERRRLRWLS